MIGLLDASIHGWGTLITTLGDVDAAQEAFNERMLVASERMDEFRGDIEETTVAVNDWTNAMIPANANIAMFGQQFIAAAGPMQEAMQQIGEAGESGADSLERFSPEQTVEQMREWTIAAEEAASATGDVFVAALGDATAETDVMAMALFQAADAAGADADTLFGLADTLGLYTESELQAALATVAMRTALDDLGTAIATGTMTMEGAMDALQGLIATLPQAADLMRQNIGTTHQYASSRQSMARSNREAAQRERELQRAMARTGDFFVDALPEITENTESWALELFQAADAAGASAEELAALGGALGIYSEEQVEAALKTAALMEKIEQLGARIAGGMDVERAIGELSAFRQDLFPVTPAQMGFSGMVGPGYGGPRMFLAGEGRRPEHVNISPTVGSYNTTNIYDQRAAAVLAEQQRRNQRDALARAM